MLQATDFLKNRLQLVKMERAKNPKIRDPTPTLRDVEETHVLFVNAHFRPFVTFAYEYHKTSMNGTVNFGSTGLIFSIEQYGEFFHDMVVHIGITEAVGGLAATVCGVSSTAPICWAEYLGLKLFRRVAFTVNGTILDEYTSMSENFYSQFMVTPNKLPGWNRLVGQSNQSFINGISTQTAGGFAWENGQPSAYTNVLPFTRGLSQPLITQPAFNLWIPLLFWFNLDCRVSFPSIAVPYGQRFIQIDLAPLSELLYQSTDLVEASVAPCSALNAKTFGPTTLATTPTVQNVAIYTNNIFVHKDIHEIYLKRVGFNMVRVHREQFITITANNESWQLQQLKWPIEHMFVAIRPKTNYNHPYLWYRNYAVPNGVAPQVFYPDGASPTATWSDMGNIGQTQLLEPWNTIDTITLTLHNVIIYQFMHRTFFNSYIPFIRGQQSVNTPFQDTGSLMITFNLYPTAYQPSGYINISRAREFYIDYFSSVIGTVPFSHLLNGGTSTSFVTGELLIQASAINFLLVSDGSAVLRYTT